MTQIQAVLTDEQTSREQFSIFREMTPERRWKVAESLYWTARRMKAAWLRNLNPEWTEEQIDAEVTRVFQHARG